MRKIRKKLYLSSTYNMGTVATANGFLIQDGLIVTTYHYLQQALRKGQNILISDSLANVYELEGIVTINQENDIAILKVKNKAGNSIEIKEVSKLQKEDALITISSKTGVGLTYSKGIILSTDTNIQTSIPITEELQGSPVFDDKGNLVGMINSKTVNTSISYMTNLDVIKEYDEKFAEVRYEEIKSIPFQELKEKYYIPYQEEAVINTIPQEKWNEYEKVENAQELISLKLVKGSYQDKIMTLRYKNDISEYIDTMQLVAEYQENLIQKGYQEKKISDSKIIYEKGKNQIIIKKEFDYLILVMVKV